jgi:hypothetical protein
MAGDVMPMTDIDRCIWDCDADYPIDLEID